MASTSPATVTTPSASVIKSVSLVCPMVVPSIAMLSTVSAVSVPSEVMLPCAAEPEAIVPVIVPPDTLIPALNTGIWFIVTTPPDEIAMASVSLAEPILPAFGITILPPVVMRPPPVYVPETSRFALASTSVAFSSISSVALMSSTVPLGALMYWDASLNCICIVEFSRIPVSATCVIVTSWSLPRYTTPPSARYKSENSAEAVPSVAPSAASGTRAVTTGGLLVHSGAVPALLTANN